MRSPPKKRVQSPPKKTPKAKSQAPQAVAKRRALLLANPEVLALIQEEADRWDNIDKDWEKSIETSTGLRKAMGDLVEFNGALRVIAKESLDRNSILADQVVSTFKQVDSWILINKSQNTRADLLMAENDELRQKLAAKSGRAYTGRKAGRPSKNKAAASKESLEGDRADAILANAEEALKKKSNAELDRNLKELRERF